MAHVFMRVFETVSYTVAKAGHPDTPIKVAKYGVPSTCSQSVGSTWPPITRQYPGARSFCLVGLRGPVRTLDGRFHAPKMPRERRVPSPPSSLIDHQLTGLTHLITPPTELPKFSHRVRVGSLGHMGQPGSACLKRSLDCQTCPQIGATSFVSCATSLARKKLTSTWSHRPPPSTSASDIC